MNDNKFDDLRWQRLMLHLEERYPAVFWFDPGPAAPATAKKSLGYGHRWGTAQGGFEHASVRDIAGQDRFLWLHHEFAGGYPADRGRPLGWAIEPAAWLTWSGNEMTFGGPEAHHLQDLWNETARGGSLANTTVATTAIPRPAAVTWRMGSEQFEDLVEECRALTVSGVFTALCPTNQATVGTDALAPGEALRTYLRFRREISAPTGGFVRCGDWSLLSASPERFLLVKTDGTIRAEPIKGTRLRSANPVQDRAIAKELRYDMKELAENASVTRQVAWEFKSLCRPDSVQISQPTVRTFTHVHQLVGAVTGELLVPTATALGLILPVASMLGEPKMGAFRFLREAEGAPRGAYSGIYGWLGAAGEADLRVTIRSVVAPADGPLTVGAGAGVNEFSVVSVAAAETAAKAEPLLRAVGG